MAASALTSRKSLHAAALCVPLLLFALPIAAALPVAVWQGASRDAWSALLADPLVPRALALSVGSALISTLVSLAFALVARDASVRHARLGPARARARPDARLPHAAFAIGLALLVMPAGVIARVLAPLLGWSAPPPIGRRSTIRRASAWCWCSICKETPFLLWNLVALLTRPELALQLRGWLASARTLGYADAAAVVARAVAAAAAAAGVAAARGAGLWHNNT